MIQFGTPNFNNWHKYKKFLSIHKTCIISPSSNIHYITEPFIIKSPEHRSPITSDNLNVPIKNNFTNLEIGAESHIFCQFNFILPNAKITIGERCQIGNVNFSCASEIILGDDILMAWGINIVDSNHHSIYWEERQYDVIACRNDYIESDGRGIGQSQDFSVVKKKKITIGSKSWIGLNAIILKGVTIGEGAIIAPGSVITKDVEPWTMVGGNPGCFIKKIVKEKTNIL
ncbi:putative Acetyltransferase (Isoleucine patch superfamily)-like protein [Desulfamplus magnetovallimortis]|uniref:Putative Acetyltransferase (Isoleucine patch superfamily)-like protein n=1 Tax=Desulfamplus magnetovallimortis TaxID=1246637 RepID=A0A1W1HEP9_9BACT|nr:acyltransferase [Desulfamplus magnetovallimortis]SLM30969.1 putative Acetyltransferase (Isoleucine patch superfamily)-like protein [Desulfamplus magnetovallimortis]